MIRSLVVAATLAATLAGLGARAGAEPAVDVADLPPLPPAQDDATRAATVLAATSVEEDVVVGAAKREQSLGNVASAVTVISADRIKRFGYRTVSEAIAAVAGVFVQDNRLTQQVGIRGLQIEGGFNSRILILVDGATINEQWGGFAGVGFDGIVSIDDISRIEVIRGPVGALYGTTAFFGIINIVTRGAGEGTRAWGKLGVHSLQGPIATAGFATGGVHKQLRGSVFAMTRLGETLDVPDIGNGLKGDGARTLIASLVGSYNGAFAQVRAARSIRDSPFAPYDSDPGIVPPYTLTNTQLLVEGGYTREVSKRLVVAARGYSNLYKYDDVIRADGSANFIDVGQASTFGAEVRGRYALDAAGKFGVTAGGEANYNRTESRAFFVDDTGNAIVVPLDFSIQGAYTEVDGQPTKWLGFTGGVRFDNNSVIDNRLTPRGALFLQKPEKYGLKLLASSGFRNPTAFEGFFADGVDFSANTKIRSETVRAYEVVLWARPIAGMSLRLSGFAWDARDVVEQRPDPEDEALLQFQNVGRYVTQGLEVEGSYRNADGWYGFGGLTAARIGTEVDEGSGPELAFGGVVNSPSVSAVGGISTPRIGKLAHLSTEVVYLGPRGTRPQPDGSISTRSPAWLGWNATVYVPAYRRFDVTAGVRNILGTRDLLPAPGDYDRFPNPMTTIVVPRVPGEGREVYVKIGYSY
ncbi:MAG: TonB-dependent receptor [Deltaproteobacteria bacterium]|nr:TonB-dependent receptor [Deltaproteobacteria bacterium]